MFIFWYRAIDWTAYYTLRMFHYCHHHHGYDYYGSFVICLSNHMFSDNIEWTLSHFSHRNWKPFEWYSIMAPTRLQLQWSEITSHLTCLRTWQINLKTSTGFEGALYASPAGQGSELLPNALCALLKIHKKWVILQIISNVNRPLPIV